MNFYGDDVLPTLQTVAAVTLLRNDGPDFRVRVVNVVDRMVLQPQSEHRHGLMEHDFDALLGHDGTPQWLHQQVR